jgi:ABC-type Zn uptake system ZnuABC Zn-binding protein ZnuA
MSDCPTQEQLTADEQAAMDQVQTTLTFKNGRYEIGIPWKKDKPEFTNNYELALSRLNNLERSLQKKDPKIRESYTKIIEDYSEKGYVRKTTQKDENQWFLPTSL